MDNLSSSLDLVFGALADPTRRAVLERLGEGEASIGELAQPFDMALPSLMKHVRVLEAVGLVESQKSGRVRTCRLKPAAMTDAERWLVEQRAANEPGMAVQSTKLRTVSTPIGRPSGKVIVLEYTVSEMLKVTRSTSRVVPKLCSTAAGVTKPGEIETPGD